MMLHLHVPALGKVLSTYGCFCLGGLIHHKPFLILIPKVVRCFWSNVRLAKEIIWQTDLLAAHLLHLALGRRPVLFLVLSV